MIEYIYPQEIDLNNYRFNNFTYAALNGITIIRVEEQEHLDQILSDIENGIVPEPPLPPPTEQEIILSETILRQLDAEQRVTEFEMVISQLILQLMDNNALNA